MEVFAVEARRLLAPQHAQRGDCLVRTRATLMEIQAERVELLLEPAAADAQDDTAARKDVDRGDLLGDIERVTLRKNQDAGGKPDTAGERGGIRERQQRVGNRDVLAAGNLAARRIWIRRLVVVRDDDVLDGPDRLEAALLRGFRQMRQHLGLRERPRIGEHQPQLDHRRTRLFFDTSDI
jgi:hypothetical protein